MRGVSKRFFYCELVMNGVFFWVGRNGEEKVVRVNYVLRDIVILCMFIMLLKII